MARKKGLMSHKHDIFDRLELTTSVDQTYNAIAVICRLKDDAYQYFNEDSKSLKKWNEECNRLRQLFDKFSCSIREDKKKIVDLLEEFIEEFEHVERRLRQLLDHKGISESDRRDISNATTSWLDALLRFSVYALLLEYRGKHGKPQIIRVKTKLVIPTDKVNET